MSATDIANLERLLRQQESLREVIESISSELELRPLLTRIVRKACELLDADNGTIGLVDEQRNVIRTEAAYRMPPDELGAEMPPGVGLAGQVFLTRQPVILDRYGEVEKPLQRGMLENAVIGMPIFWGDRLIGFFGLGSPPPRRFTAQDVEVLSLFAKHAAVAIENARLFASMQRTLGETQLLYETSRRISTAMRLDEVVAAYLEQVAVRGRYACSVALYAFDENGKRTAVVVHGRWAPAEGLSLDEMQLPYTCDALDLLLDAGQTVLIRDVHTDPRVSEELREIQRRSERPALAMIPLITRGQRIGLVVLSYPKVHEWREAELRPYLATAAQLAIAIDSRLQQRLLFERGQQVAVLEERQRLARDLHDSVTQLLFTMTLIAQSIGPAWRRAPEEGERRVQRLLEISQAALAEMRALLAELRPTGQPARPRVSPAAGITGVPSEGLAQALRKHAEDAAHDGPRVELFTKGYVAQPPAVEEALFRIAQEALNNVLKHAQARRVEIHLRAERSIIRLRIKDDGRGFAPNLPILNERPRDPRQGGLGLSTMRERAEALGGAVRIISRPGRGTTVAVTIPKKE